jgi:hypothetical protein
MFAENIISNLNFFKENIICIWYAGTQYYTVIDKNARKVTIASELDEKCCECIGYNCKYLCRDKLNINRHIDSLIVNSASDAIDFVEAWRCFIPDDK